MKTNNMDIVIEQINNLEFISDSKDIIKKSIQCTLQVENLLDKEGEVYVTVVDSDTIHQMNREYRNIDKTTDVLSFPLDNDFNKPYIILGDIFINSDKILEQAEEYGHSVERELAYLSTHSALHLLGYDHITDEDKEVMRKKEKKILNILGIFK